MQAKFERDYLDATPQELREVCLNCSRPKCSGDCVKFDDAYRRYRNDNYVRTYKRRGSMIIMFEGRPLSLNEFSRICGYHITTIRRKLRSGVAVDEIYRQAQFR